MRTCAIPERVCGGDSLRRAAISRDYLTFTYHYQITTISDVTCATGHLAGERAERPVAGVGGVTMERQRQNEQLVGESQVPDVVVADRTGPYLVVLGDDIDDKRIANEAEHERDQVDSEGYRSDVSVAVPQRRGGVVGQTAVRQPARNR